MWFVRPAKAQTSLRIWAVWSEHLLIAWIFYEYSATDWTSFGVSKLKRGCTGSSESIHVKISHCWKSHVVAQLSPDRWGLCTLEACKQMFANSECPDEMLQNTAFHHGLHCFLRQKTSPETEIYHNFKVLICCPSNFTMDNSKVIISNHKEESINT